MKSFIAAVLVLGASAAPADAEQRYDKRLEAAAISIVAKKMGDLRGGFDTQQAPVFVAPIDRTRPTHLSARTSSGPAVLEPADAAPRSSFVSF